MRSQAIALLQQVLATRYHKRIVEIQDPFVDMKLLLAGRRVSTVVDGGAYHGEVADRLLDLCPAAQAIAFEPARAAFAYLQTKYAGSMRVIPVHAALSAQTGPATLYTNVQDTTNALSPVGPGGRLYQSWQTENVGREPTTTVTLDRWLQDHPGRTVELLKLDVQGHELHALQGAAQTLRATVRLVYVEVEFVRIYEDNCLYHELAAYLAACGFELFQLYHLSCGPDRRLVTGDAIFIHPERVSL